MTFASVSAVTVTLLLVGVFYILLMNLNEVAKSVENDVQIKVLIDTTADQKQQDLLEKEIKSMKEVSTVTFSTKENELDQLINSMGEDGAIFKLYEQENPLNDAFIVKTKNPEDTKMVAERIVKLQNVYDVNYGKDVVDKLFKVINASRNVGIILIVGLLFTAIFLISNTIKITIVARRREIEIMRLVGATNGFIRWPFFLEGLWLGILGSVVPIVSIATLYKYVYDLVAPSLQNHFINLLEYNPFIFQTSGFILLLGCLIGIWGSTMSIRKFLRV